MFENKYIGIFKALDDTGKMHSQTASDFIHNIFENWANSPILVKPKLRGIQENTGFIIRHFVGDVYYNIVSITVPKCLEAIFKMI